eukprot:TRINITY_DN265_c0_g1_i1.p1 TRINITY_DN265_c0_g1~~TRINITY_DN265_c0_g1_i1.p1  ORF type:complete len:306 (+),score=1.54 TRINITY_DN265_c0_g1_i1:168-1085(+)
MQAKTVFVSSPLNRHYNLFRKEVYVKTLYMPEWSETEMETLYKEIGGMDREEFNNKLTKLGGVPRLVFGTVVDSADRLIARAISKINFRTWDGAINDLETTEGSNSNVILHILPIHNYTSYEYVFGSKYIERLVFQRLYNKNTTKLAQLLESSLDLNFTPLLSGALFEQYAHRRLQAGGVFKIRSLQSATSAPSELRIDTKNVEFVDSFVTKELQTYYLPNSNNFECVDSWMPSIGFFQMTIAAKHPISELIAKILSIAPEEMTRFYFVVPEKMFSHFTKQNLKNYKKRSVNQTQIISSVVLTSM